MIKKELTRVNVDAARAVTSWSHLPYVNYYYPNQTAEWFSYREAKSLLRAEHLSRHTKALGKDIPPNNRYEVLHHDGIREKIGPSSTYNSGRFASAPILGRICFRQHMLERADTRQRSNLTEMILETRRQKSARARDQEFRAVAAVLIDYADISQQRFLLKTDEDWQNITMHDQDTDAVVADYQFLIPLIAEDGPLAPNRVAAVDVRGADL